LGIEPQVWIAGLLESPLPEGDKVRIELADEAAHLALGHARGTHRAHQVVDLAGADPLPPQMTATRARSALSARIR